MELIHPSSMHEEQKEHRHFSLFGLDNHGSLSLSSHQSFSVFSTKGKGLKHKHPRP